MFTRAFLTFSEQSPHPPSLATFLGALPAEQLAYLTLLIDRMHQGALCPQEHEDLLALGAFAGDPELSEGERGTQRLQALEEVVATIRFYRLGLTHPLTPLSLCEPHGYRLTDKGLLYLGGASNLKHVVLH